MAGLDDYTGTFNDKLDQYLASEGNSGNLNDKLNTSADYSGNVGQKLSQYFLLGVPAGWDPKTWAGYATGGDYETDWESMETGESYERSWQQLQS